ncbi:MAG: glycine cleavage system aminomethyltransferase GcvT [Planctomycetales bacterium]|nr:glycine cleavage system aminomethyltransferase GcvT [Planctomycetales bacterium]
MNATLLQTPLYDWHVALGARMVDFGGWSMPVQYSTIVEEHRACRTSAALFDVSHMGRFRFDGPGAEAFLDHLCTRKIAGMAIGRIRYSFLLNEEGGILDDVLVYRLPQEGGGSYFWMVVNAGNREKIAAWIEDRLASTDCDVRFTDASSATAMIALQGPQAIGLAQSLTDAPLANMPNYSAVQSAFAGVAAMISRTGYTGEDGVEVTSAAEDAGKVASLTLALGQQIGARPAGLGARDTLRLEAAMPLYGHELSEAIGPVQTGVGFAITLTDHEFVGREAVLKEKANAATPRRVGLELAGRRVPREGYEVLLGDRRVGEVTSGTFSPTLEKPIAMAYVEPGVAETGTALAIDIRGRREPATVVDLPFYKRSQD